MDMSAEERQAVRELLAQIRQVSEDFVHVYVNRLRSAGLGKRLALQLVLDSGEMMLATFADDVASLSDPALTATALGTLNEGATEHDFLQGYSVLIESFHWAAERCLGVEFTALARSGHRKLAMLAPTAAMSRAGERAASWTPQS